ncbi:hypothetical protein B1757_13025 [Acidithiobacillus marinus]|uniref:Type I restriction modification DNA specificity domain-containing protein n=1 Tax=Acidithiobacillus marinus TaxID=187490 RepID=A0A2I1DIU8_9PROT|nr:restriction endonuclease subunit S [Acidithiobacillus marinus]PKY09804.1 hypothetical protein B1757_13025 [Acidithiobacillus marinus]
MSHYRPYPAYRDSGVEWIGDVPSHWKTLRLANVGSLMKANGGSKQDDSDCGVPCVRYGDLYTTYDFLIRNIPKFIKPETEIGYTPIKYGDLLLAASGETFEEIGKSAVNLVTADACCGGDIVILRPNREIDPVFLAYAAGSISAQAQKSLMGKGFTVIHVYGDQLRNLVIAAPAEQEQEIIGAKIERETARIDALISKKTRFIELITEKILAMVDHSFEHQDTRWIRLQHVCEIISRPVSQQDGEGYTRLGLYNRGRGAFKKEEAGNEDMGDSDFFWIDEGDLILSGQFAWEGAVALATKEHSSCVVSHRFPVIQGRNGESLTEYLFALFMTHYGDFILNDCSRGSAGRNRPLNINALLKWKIPIPPIDYQKQIALLVSLREQIRVKTERSIALLKERRSSLITAAVTGQIDLRGEIA